ncbi:MAG: enoyl-CoA hydratase [Rhodospirillaceae bacterium]|nr:enoyl-CoA hydratase [Rhodospirillaceae bacterium]
MAISETISITQNDAVATISLSRPDVRNAMNPEMIREITAAFEAFNIDDSIRVIVIRGEGAVFCAGGDLNWMKDVLDQTEEQVVDDSRHLLNMYRSINGSPKLVIAALRGAAVAGGLGIISCADVVIAETDTKFCISEVKIGLVPGIIAAFILPRVGPSWFRYLSKTAILFDTETARMAGLIHEVAQDDDDLEHRVAAHTKRALNASPDAIADTGRLISTLGYDITEDNLSTGLLFNAKARLSDAAQEGISAFLEKRPPAWKANS